jgi:hypothetical protein
MMQRAIRSVGALLLIAALFWLGVLLHEAGHVVSAWIFGARLTRLNVLGLELVPRLGWHPLADHYGLMSFRGALTPHQRDVMRLWGSLATLGAALAAQAILWLTRPHRGAVRLCVLTLCFFWLDILTHTLPTLGIPAYLLFGTRTVTSSAEAYLAAVALGMPGRLFQALAVGVSVALLAATLIRWRLLRCADRLLTGSTHP